MLDKLIPREEKFFELFKDSARLSLEGTKAFRELLDHVDQAEERARHIKDLEGQADEVAHKTVELLHKTFITPLDREDIHRLITRMDDILDRIEGASHRIYMYDFKSATPEAKKLADICVQSVEHVVRAVNSLEDLTYTSGILQDCVDINRLENDADHVLRSAVAKLFKSEMDARELIKHKELYEMLESVTDRCEDVANVIQGIVLEYA